MNKLIKLTILLILLSFNVNCVEKEQTENNPANFTKEEITDSVDNKLKERINDIVVMMGGTDVKHMPIKKEYLDSDMDDTFIYYCYCCGLFCGVCLK